MNYNHLLIVALFTTCLFNTSLTLAQSSQPYPLVFNSIKDAALDEASMVSKESARYDCYAIDTTAGQQTTIAVESSAFDPVIEVARGALCHVSTLQYENDNANDSTTSAQVSFKAAGGRYLVLIKSKSQQAYGAYRLKIGGDPAQVAQAPTNKEDQRKQIMEMEIAKREAEKAVAEAKRKAEQAEFEAKLAAMPTYNNYDEEYYEPPRPQQNILTVFAETLNSELAKQQQAERDFQQGLNQAIRQGEAQRQQRLAAERAAEARQVAALQKSQEAEKARQEAEEVQRRAEEKLRLLNITNTNVARNTHSSVSAPTITPQTTAKSPGKASIKSDPQLCISQPQQVRNPNCKDGAAFSVTNSCEGPVDLRICVRTTKGRWDCGTHWGVKAGAVASWPSCFGTTDVFVAARHSDSEIPLGSPP
jgi:hypothetical protein